MAKKISYATRDFAGLRQELVNLTKEYYPDLVKNTNDASIFNKDNHYFILPKLMELKYRVIDPQFHYVIFQ